MSSSMIEETSSTRIIAKKSDKVYVRMGEKSEPYLLSYTISCSVDEDESAYLEQINEAMKELELALADEKTSVNSSVRDGHTKKKRTGVPMEPPTRDSAAPVKKQPAAAAVASFSLTNHRRGGGGDEAPSYLVEHLATFGVGQQFGVQWPEDGLRKLKQMERSSAIWAQRMVLRLRRDVISVEDENGEVVEQFPLHLVSDPTSFISQDPRDAYNNLLVFTVNEDRQRRSATPTEMHIFQVKHVPANEVAEDIRLYLDGRFSQVQPGLHDSGFEVATTTTHHREREPSYPAPRPPTATNTTTAAAHPHPSPNRGGEYRTQEHHRFNRASSTNYQTGGGQRDEFSSPSPDFFERDVNTLNRCFDDIERFVARIQSAALAQRDLDMLLRRGGGGPGGHQKRAGRHPDEPILRSKAQLPPEPEFVASFQKFKLCFNILAKLKNHIHEPNAPELLHFLFTPLTLILDACHWGLGRNVAPNVITPLITREAKDLLLNCLTSKETDVWMSLGEAWRVPAQDWPHPLPANSSPYTPTFDGGFSSGGPSARVSPQGGFDQVDNASRARFGVERERLAMKEEALRERERALHEEKQSLSAMKRRLDEDRRSIGSGHPPNLEEDHSSRHISRSMGDIQHRGGIERDIPITLASSAGESPRQRAYLDELRSRRARAVQVTYDRVGQNPKELTVKKGEYLEVISDTKKWWECKNVFGRAGYVPNTIVTVVDPTSSTGEKAYTNGATGARPYDQPLFVRPGVGGSNSGPPSAAYAQQDRGAASHLRGGSTSPHANPYAPGGPDTPEYLKSRIGKKGEFRYF